MKPIAELAALATVFLLLTPTSEGVRCYDCISSDDARSLRTDMGDQNDTARHHNYPPDAACGTSKPSFTASCDLGCYKQTQPSGGKNLYLRGCRHPTHPSSGCRTVKYGEQCYCTTDLCNESYSLSHQRMVLAISLVIGLHYILPYDFNHY